MGVLVKALGYYSHKGGNGVKAVARLKEHLKYLEHGKEHPNQPIGFSSDRDVVIRQEFLRKVELQPQRGVIAHKLVFSLSQDERDRLGIDLRQLVRSVMDDWSSRLGRPLNWIAFEHQDNGHPHVHVVVGGHAGDKQVGIYERDLTALRGATEREKERQALRERTLPRGREEPELGPEVAKIARELGHLLTHGRGPEFLRPRDVGRGR